jgi:hypothetical protein
MKVFRTYSRSDVIMQGLKHGHPTFLWQEVTPIIVGWFTGHTLKDDNK